MKYKISRLKTESIVVLNSLYLILSIKNYTGLNVNYRQWCGLFFTFSPV